MPPESWATPPTQPGCSVRVRARSQPIGCLEGASIVWHGKDANVVIRSLTHTVRRPFL